MENLKSEFTLDILERIIGEACDCKLREKCLDKSSSACLKHRNIYAEAMLSRGVTRLN